MKKIVILCAVACSLFMGCKKAQSSEAADGATTTDSIPQFSADSAMSTLKAQCNFGPRVMNSEAHDKCRDYIAAKFRAYGATVTLQNADLKGWDGTVYKSTNIIAAINPKATNRIVICTHWDSRPWADNDSDESKHKTPVMAANDGASGVSVLLELARQLQAKAPAIGVDLICFDAEDCGTPKWAGKDDESTWCLGSQYWATHPHTPGYKARYGVLLDMVGGQGARFYYEGFSKQYANDILTKVWQAATDAGFSGYFPAEDGGYITDDHLPMNRAGIPTVDVIALDKNSNSGFPATWHTTHDVPENIDPGTMGGVGQAMLQLIYSEK